LSKKQTQHRQDTQRHTRVTTLSVITMSRESTSGVPVNDSSVIITPPMHADYRNLMNHLRAAMSNMKAGRSQEAEAELRFAKGIVNVTEYLEPNAKTYMTAVFAEFHSAILSQDRSREDRSSLDSDAADTMFDNYLQSMRFMYGGEHVVMGDCYVLVGASQAVRGRYSQAIEVSRERDRGREREREAERERGFIFSLTQAC
jgi:hypothetical protein